MLSLATDQQTCPFAVGFDFQNAVGFCLECIFQTSQGLRNISPFPPYYWDPVSKQFVTPTSHSLWVWRLSVLNVTILTVGVPSYMALSRIYGIGAPLLIHEAIFLALEFFAGIHALGFSIMGHFHGSQVSWTLNEIISMEKYFKGMNIIFNPVF